MKRRKDKAYTENMQEEFLQFYESQADAIFRHCYFRISDKEKANDLMQEAFMKTWKYLADGNQVDNLRAFIYRVANNLLIDEYRKKDSSSLDAMQEKGFEPARDNPVKKLHIKTDASIALTYLEELNEKEREAIIMRYVDDMRVKDIASILGEDENTISVRLHRAKKNLHSIIQKKNI